MITVKNNNVGTSARKIRQVVDLIRKKKVEDALKILRFCEKKETAVIVTKLINSGLAIAADSKKYDLDNLVIEMVKVDEGPSLKRIMPRAQGRAYRISKKSSYITLSLKEA
jgi:large subunit ribosomal protein L22